MAPALPRKAEDVPIRPHTTEGAIALAGSGPSPTARRAALPGPVGPTAQIPLGGGSVACQTGPQPAAKASSQAASAGRPSRQRHTVWRRSP
jgi:hypothetical protein